MSGNGDVQRIKDGALNHLAKELHEAKVPAVLSSYMKTDKLPESYAGIDEYVKGIREQLIREVGGKLSQLQMIVLDGISEVLIVLKYISTYIAESPNATIVHYDKFGVPFASDLVSKGFSGLHQVLDKKLKQFHDLSSGREDELSPAEIHRRAIMGEHRATKDLPTGKFKTGRPLGIKPANQKDPKTGRFLKTDQAEGGNGNA